MKFNAVDFPTDADRAENTIARLRERVAELEETVRRANTWCADLASGLSDALAQRDQWKARAEAAEAKRDALRADAERLTKEIEECRRNK